MDEKNKNVDKEQKTHTVNDDHTARLRVVKNEEIEKNKEELMKKKGADRKPQLKRIVKKKTEDSSQAKKTAAKKSPQNTVKNGIEKLKPDKSRIFKSVKKDDSEDRNSENTKEKKNGRKGLSYRQKYIILTFVVIFAFVVAYPFVRVREIDFNKLSKNIERNVSMENLTKGNDLTLRRLYSISRPEVEEYISFAPKSNMIADEILVIKSKPENQDAIMKKIQARIDSQTNSFKNYAPAQVNIISGSELKKKGDYIIFISSPNMDKVKDSIKESYK